MLTQSKVGNIICLMLDASEGCQDVACMIVKAYSSRIANVSVSLEGAIAVIASNIVRLFGDRGFPLKNPNPEKNDMASRLGQLLVKNLHGWLENYRTYMLSLYKNDLS